MYDIITIDSGKLGAIGYYSSFSDSYFVKDIPLRKSSNGKKEIDIELFYSILNGYIIVSIRNKRCVILMIEDIHTIYGTSSRSMFSMGNTYGKLSAVMELLFIINAKDVIRLIKVGPKEWQKVVLNKFNNLSTKERALKMFNLLYKGNEVIGLNKSKDGQIDVMLMISFLKGIKNFDKYSFY